MLLFSRTTASCQISGMSSLPCLLLSQLSARNKGNLSSSWEYSFSYLTFILLPNQTSHRDYSLHSLLYWQVSLHCFGFQVGIVEYLFWSSSVTYMQLIMLCQSFF